jgi:N-carbamoyl-L-amino-acid hydrolase
MPEVQPEVHIDLMMEELIALANITEGEPPVVTRVVYSEADLRGRTHVKELCYEAGLKIREDAIGNTFIRWEGSDPQLAPVATGSHIDAIPNAGAYDGVVGVLGGLEAIRSLQRAGFKPRRPIELIIFTSEEPTRFGIGCLGSRMMGGVLTAEQAHALVDKKDRSLDFLRTRAGFRGNLDSVQLKSGHFHAFVELHIEQGPTLEREGLDLGVVTHIAAPASLRVTIQGVGGHAGAMLMPDRHDALCAASELILALEMAAKSTGAVDSVATVGICNVFPSAVNSVPSRVQLEVDIRDIDGPRRDGMIAALKAAAASAAQKRGVTIEFETVNADPPAACDAAVMEAVQQAIAACGLSGKRMVSRAYHDSLFVARFAPVAMIFTPCRGGVSHRPDEYASPEWIAGGVEVLARALATLAS